MKVAIIGLGRMGNKHVQVLKNLNMEIVGLFDLKNENVLEAIESNNLNSDINFKKISDLYSISKPDAVAISTTAPSHCDYVCQAARFGTKFILCEKPMAISINQAQKMIEACEKYGSNLAVNHQMRFMDHYRFVKKLSLSPEFGGIVSVLVSGANCGMSMNGIHYFEFLNYITENKIEHICAWFDDQQVPNPRGKEYKDRGGNVRAVTSSGVVMYLDFSVKAGHGLQLILICKHGQIIVDELSGFVRTITRNSSSRNLPTTQYATDSDTNTFEIAPSDALKSTESVWGALINGGDFPSGHTGLNALRSLVASYTSNENKNKKIFLKGSEINPEIEYPWA